MPFNHYINLSYLESIADGNNDILKELIHLFIEQVPEFTDGSADAFKAKNWKQLGAIAHKAKSSVISIGMEELGNQDLKNLELISKLRRIEELETKKTLPDNENRELKQLIDYLQALPEEKMNWVRQNNNEEIIQNIVFKFIEHCKFAVEELNLRLNKM